MCQPLNGTMFPVANLSAVSISRMVTRGLLQIKTIISFSVYNYISELCMTIEAECLLLIYIRLMRTV